MDAPDAGACDIGRYKLAWLRHDIFAGLVLTTMLVPVGIAYAVASGVPGIYGLYATIVPLLAYALFGPSRILVLGPDSSLAAVILGVVLPLSDGDPRRAVALAGMMAIVSGAVCILAGLARLGFVTELLSKPIRYGYMNGIALTVLISQLPKLFGFSVESEGPLRDLLAIGDGDPGRQDELDRLRGRRGHAGGDPAAQGTASACRASSSRWSARPSSSALSTLRPRRGRGPGPPSPGPSRASRSPGSPASDIVPVLIGGCAVALVSFADTSVLSRVYAARTGTARRSQPGDGRARRRQPGRRLFPGLPDQQQFFANPCRRSRRRPDATDRRRRRRLPLPAADGGAQSSPAPAHPPRWPPSSSPRRSA